MPLKMKIQRGADDSIVSLAVHGWLEDWAPWRCFDDSRGRVLHEDGPDPTDVDKAVHDAHAAGLRPIRAANGWREFVRLKDDGTRAD